jgi:branched-chain amino acid transport system substrate-binding protein
VRYTGGTGVSYSSIAAESIFYSPKHIVLCAGAFDTALLAQKIKSLQPDVSLYSSAWGISAELLEYGGKAVESLVFVSPFIFDEKPEQYLAYQTSYLERFGEGPYQVAMFNYEAVLLLAEALRNSVSSDPRSVKDYILSREVHKGLLSDYSFDREGDGNRDLNLHMIRGGVFERIK